MKMEVDIIICQGSVSKIVIDILINKNVLVLSKIKPNEIKYLAQMFKIPLLPSIDLISNFESDSLIGKCLRFKFVNRGKDSYCLFVGSNTPAGCTIKL